MASLNDVGRQLGKTGTIKLSEIAITASGQTTSSTYPNEPHNSRIYTSAASHYLRVNGFEQSRSFAPTGAPSRTANTPPYKLSDWSGSVVHGNRGVSETENGSQGYVSWSLERDRGIEFDIVDYGFSIADCAQTASFTWLTPGYEYFPPDYVKQEMYLRPCGGGDLAQPADCTSSAPDGIDPFGSGLGGTETRVVNNNDLYDPGSGSVIDGVEGATLTNDLTYVVGVRMNWNYDTDAVSYDLNSVSYKTVSTLTVTGGTAKKAVSSSTADNVIIWKVPAASTEPSCASQTSISTASSTTCYCDVCNIATGTFYCDGADCSTGANGDQWFDGDSPTCASFCVDPLNLGSGGFIKIGGYAYTASSAGVIQNASSKAQCTPLCNDGCGP
jgi:hypothetical protein